jgi:hypothetical protein
MEGWLGLRAASEWCRQTDGGLRERRRDQAGCFAERLAKKQNRLSLGRWGLKVQRVGPSTTLVVANRPAWH